MLKKIIVLTLIFQSMILFAQSNYNLNEVDPPNWWVGMKNPNLQLAVHGDNVSELTPEINYPGVIIKGITKLESPNYLFIDLFIKNDTKSGHFEIKFFKDGDLKLKHKYELSARRIGSADRVGFNTSDVIYLITPDRFVNGDPSNDSVEGMLESADRSNPNGRHGGDIRGMINNLDYFNELGFTALWINPLLENNQPNYSYHGYAATDLYKIDPRYGSNKDFQELSKKANDKKIKIIKDIILNHCGSFHYWIKDPPSSDWFNYQNNFTRTNHKRSTNQDPYAAESDKQLFADGWFVKSMPDMNQRNPFMAKYLIQNSIWWIEYGDLGGIRMDTYPYPDRDFMTNWTWEVMNEYPNFNVVGEEWSYNPSFVAFWQRGKVNPNGYVSYLPSLFDFPIQGALQAALTEEDSWKDGLIKLYETLANDFIYPDPFNLVIFPDNHDTERIFTTLKNDINLLKLAVVYIATMRGIPQFYYGTEILMANINNGHGDIRMDMPGGWEGDKKNVFTKTGLTDDQLDMYNFFKTLLNWRKNSAEIHKGKLKHFAPENGVYVYFRYLDNKKVMVVINKSSEEQTLQLERYDGMLKGISSAKNVLTGEKVVIESSIIVDAKSPLILDME